MPQFKIQFDDVHQNHQKYQFNDSNEVLAFFDQIAWTEQAQAMNDGDRSPTIYICNQDTMKTLWASVMADIDDIIFIVEAELDFQVTKKFLGLFTSKSQATLSETSLSLVRTRQLIADFIEGKHQNIYRQYG